MTVEGVGVGALVLFVAGVLLGFGSTAFRLIRLHRAGITLPRLIWRDVLVFGGFAITFVAIGIHRVMGLPFADELWWAVGTSSVAVIAVWIYDFYEFVIVGHRRDAPPDITKGDHHEHVITTHGPSTITVEPDGEDTKRARR